MRLYLRLSVCHALVVLWFVFSLSSSPVVHSAYDVPPSPILPAAAQATSYTQLAAGAIHTCGLTTAGGVKCWGNNGFGQLGNGNWIDQSIPVDVTGLTSSVTVIAAGNGNSTCALLADKTVRCWGMNFDGQLGNGTTEHSNVPVIVTGLSNVVAIGSGEDHMCAILPAGAVQCWGANYEGQLGNGTTTSRSTPVAVQGLAGPVVQVVGGRSHTCAILQSGAVQCWGDNSDGQLGNGKRGTNSSTPVNVVGLAGPAKQLAGEYNNSCAVLQSGSIACWGAVADQVAKPVIGWGSGMSGVALGGLLNYCAATASGTVSCAGPFNEAGQLGNGTTEPQSAPQPVSGITGGATQVVLGYNHGCALVSEQAQCWGSNRYGQLGIGQATQRPIPLTTIGGPWAQVSAGSSHTCGVTASGAAMCWGEGYRGQLGNNTDTYSGSPVPVTGLGSAVKQISAGGEHSCAVTDGGGVQCWGYNRRGQVGSGSQQFEIRTPVAITGLSTGVKAVAAGGYFTCALTDTGGVKCWGTNSSGELGNGGNGASSNVPVSVIGLQSGVAAISAGQSHACALLDDGRVFCWGGNYGGEIGDGTSDNKRMTPVQVQSLEPAASISAGDFMTCAVLTTGGVKCWGSLDKQNASGQLLPISIEGLTSGMKAVAAGNMYACALGDDGGVKCFGQNENGQLGDGTLANRQTVAGVVGLAAGAAAVDANSSHACVLLEDGAVRCWGQDGDGQLGIGTTAR